MTQARQYVDANRVRYRDARKLVARTYNRTYALMGLVAVLVAVNLAFGRLPEGSATLLFGLPGMLVGLVTIPNPRRHGFVSSVRRGLIRPPTAAEQSVLVPVVKEIAGKLGLQSLRVMVDATPRSAGRQAASAFVVEGARESTVVVGVGAIALGIRDPSVLRGLVAHELAHLAHGDAAAFHDAWHNAGKYRRAGHWGTGTVALGYLVVAIGAAAGAGEFGWCLGAIVLVIGALQTYVFHRWVYRGLRKADEELASIARDAERFADWAAIEVVGEADVINAVMALVPEGAVSESNVHYARKHRLADIEAYVTSLKAKRGEWGTPTSARPATSSPLPW